MNKLLEFTTWILAINPDITTGEAGRIFKVWRG